MSCFEEWFCLPNSLADGSIGVARLESAVSWVSAFARIFWDLGFGQIYSTTSHGRNSYIVMRGEGGVNLIVRPLVDLSGCFLSEILFARQMFQLCNHYFSTSCPLFISVWCIWQLFTKSDPVPQCETASNIRFEMFYFVFPFSFTCLLSQLSSFLALGCRLQCQVHWLLTSLWRITRNCFTARELGNRHSSWNHTEYN